MLCMQFVNNDEGGGGDDGAAVVELMAILRKSHKTSTSLSGETVALKSTSY